MLSKKFPLTFRRCVLVLASSGFGLMSLAHAQEPEAMQSSEGAIALISQETLILDALRETVDRSQFELESVIETHDWSTEELIEFVRNKIAFEQYPGALRGARGTLMSRAGNSLDQALLLATLLKDVGEDARIVRGRLSPEQAIRLLAEMDRSPDSPPPADVEAWNQISQSELAEIDIDNSPQPDQDQDDQDVDVATDVARLLEIEVAKKAQLKTTGPTQDEVIEEARDYFWVEYRDSTTAAWTGVHPVFVEDVWNPGEIKAAEFYTSEIPSELNHQIRIAVFVERWELGNLIVDQVVPNWQRPVANILGHSFYFFNAPGNFNDDVLSGEYSQLLESSKLFVPVFAGQVVPGSRGFDIDGVPYDLMAQAGGGLGATALFQTAGAKTDAAAAALYNLDSEAPTGSQARYLTAQWIEYTLITPGGKETAARRFLFDRIGPTVRESGNADKLSLERAQPWQVFVSEEFMVAAGSYPGALTLNEYLSRRVGTNELLQTYIESARLSFQDFAEAEGGGSGPNTTTLLSLFQGFDNGIVEHLGAPTYRSGPTLLALHSSAVSPGKMRFSTDIISNGRRSKAWQNAPLARRDIILHGVWETVTERRALQLLGIPGMQVDTPLAAFLSSSGTNGVQLFSSASQLVGIGLSAEHWLQLQSDLDSGFWVATAIPAEGQPFSWWRFDPGSGTVVGMLYNGRGATATEYVTGLIGIAAGAMGALGIYSLGKCTFEKLGGQSSGAKVRPLECCLIDEWTEDGSFPETLAFKWAMSTDVLKRQVGMDEELCMGHVGSGNQ